MNPAAGLLGMTDTFVPLNRIIAISRLVFCVLAIFLVPHSFTSRDELIYLPLFFSIFYIFLSVIFVLTSLFDWWIDFLFRPYALSIDIFIPILILIFLNSEQIYQFYLICAAFELHLCFFLVFTMGVRRSVLPSCFLGLLICALALYSGNLRLTNVVLDIVPLAATLIVIPVAIWVASQLGRIVLPRLMEENLKADTPLTTSMLKFARSASGAGEAVLLWVDSEDSRCYFVRSGSCEVQEPQPLPNFSLASEVRALVPMIFDIGKGAAVPFDKRRAAIGRASQALPGRHLFNDLDIRDGICMPLDVASHIQPWLVLSGMRAMSWGHLFLVFAISKELSVAANWFEDTLDAKADALRQLRRTVASDLHDSVAQSLAGAKFLLAALKSRMKEGSPALEEIDEIRAALDAEHLHVRSLIRQLRNEEREHNEVDLIVDLRTTCEIMKARWKVTIIFENVDFRILIPIWFSIEMQQITREAISNGVRHAGASEIYISCRKMKGEIQLNIGNNLDQSKTAATKEFSPLSIKERLQSFGGKMSIQRTAERTTLEVVVPLYKIAEASSGFELKDDA